MQPYEGYFGKTVLGANFSITNETLTYLASHGWKTQGGRVRVSLNISSRDGDVSARYTYPFLDHE